MFTLKKYTEKISLNLKLVNHVIINKKNCLLRIIIVRELENFTEL